MKQLQQLGAIVYPPGEKKEVDWGLLAGLLSLDKARCTQDSDRLLQSLVTVSCLFLNTDTCEASE